MIVECPKCKSTYNLPDDKVESGDMKVRCTECKEVFTAQAARVPEPGEAEPEAPEAPESGDAEPEAPDDLDALGDALGEDVAEPEEDAEAEAPGDEAGEADAAEPEEGDAEAGGDEGSEEEEAAGDEAGDAEPKDKDKDKAPSLDDGKGEALSFDIGGGTKEKKKLKIKISKKLGIILAAAVLVLVLGGGAAWYFLSSGTPATGLKVQAEEDEEVREDVRNISLKNIRQYYVDNDKAGRIFVVEGRAVNDFETPKGFIKIQADLFDEEGRVLGTHGFLCGNSLSLYQLQVLGEEEIQSALADQAGIASSNVDLAPGMDVPFMAVFFNPPESVREFMIKVVEAKDPAPVKE